MKFLPSYFAKSHPIQKSKPSTKIKGFRRLVLENLESRINPADLVVSSLLFRGDLIADGNLWKATGSPVEIGFNPTQGEAFRSLVTLAGDTIIDSSAQKFQFQGTASFPGKSGQIDFWSATTLSTFDIQTLVGSGASIVGKSFQISDLVSTANTLTLENPNGGDSTDGQLKLTGGGNLSFGTANNGTAAGTLPTVDALEITIGNGSMLASGTVNGNLRVAGTNWELQGDKIYSDLVKEETKISGSAEFDFIGQKVPVKLEESGLVISQGKYSKLATSSVTPIPMPVGVFNLKSMAAVGGQASVNFKRDAAGNETISVTGQFGFNMKGYKKGDGTNITASLTLSLSGDGIVIRDGAVRSWEATINGTIGWTSSGASTNVKNWGFEVRNGSVWYAEDTNTYGIAGSIYLPLGIKEFKAKNDIPGMNVKAGETVKSEANNYIEFLCGTKESPGFEWESGGTIKRVDVSVTVKRFGTHEKRDDYFKTKRANPSASDSLILGGIEFHVNQLGVLYKDNDWAFYGNVALSNNSNSLKGGSPYQQGYDQGVGISVSLGTKANPGLLIEDTGNGNYDWKLENFKLEIRLGYYGGFCLRELVISWSTDKSDPDYPKTKAMVAAQVDITPNLSVGGMISWTTYVNDTTGVTNTYPSDFKISLGVPKGGVVQGWMIKPGIYLTEVSAAAYNLDDVENLRFVGTATFSIGPMLPAGVLESRPVHSLIVDGKIDISAKRILVEANVHLLAYYDQVNDLADQNPWKSILGEGKGKLTIDWTNNIYEVSFEMKMLDLVSGNFLMRITDDGLLLYTSVHVAPTPYGKFDFWPVNLIDIKGTMMLLLSSRERVFGAWVELKIIFWNVDVGMGYDFNKGSGFLMGSGGIAEMEAMKAEFLAGYQDFTSYSYDINAAAADSSAFQSSRVTVSIPFYSTDMVVGNKSLHKIKAGDIEVGKILYGKKKEALPEGISYDTSIDLDTLENGDVRGNVKVNFYPNKDKKLDFTKNFQAFASADFALSLEVKVRKEADTFFNDIGPETQTAIIDKIRKNPTEYYVNGNWSNTATISQTVTLSDGGTKTIQHPLIPDDLVKPLYASPILNAPVIDKLSETVNKTTFAFDVNNSKITSQNGTTSMLFVEQAELQSMQWTVMLKGIWHRWEGHIGAVADGIVVVPNDSFTQAEKTAFKRGRVYEWPTNYTEPEYAPGTEVIFLSPSGNSVREFKGTITKLGYVGNNTRTYTIETADGTTETISGENANYVKPLWKEVGQVKLLNKSSATAFFPVNGVAVGTFYKDGYQEKDDEGNTTKYLELFEIKQKVTLGNLPVLSDSVYPGQVCVGLPNYVSRVMDAEGIKVGVQYYPSSDWNVSVLKNSQNIHVLSVNGNRSNTPDDPWADSLLSIKDLNQLDISGQTTNTIEWRNSELSPTPKFAYVVVDDGINAPVFSNFVSFLPTVSIQGRVLLKDDSQAGVPEAGTVVFIDLNNDGLFNGPENWADINGDGLPQKGEFFDRNGDGIHQNTYEPYAITNSQGGYYFYDLPVGPGKVTFNLAGNRVPVGGGDNTLVFTRTSGVATTLPDFILKSVYPEVRGRVVIDSNFNGVIEPGEPGIDGAKVIITGENGTRKVAYSDPEGYYSTTLTDGYGGTVAVNLEETVPGTGTILTTIPIGSNTRQITGIDYLKSAVYTHDFSVEAQFTIDFDSPDGLTGQFVQMLKLLSAGKLTGLGFKTSGFQFQVSRFELLPDTEDGFGLKTASGYVKFGDQILRFEMKGPRGLVISGTTLKEMNLRLYSDLDIFGAKLNLNNLTGKYVAGDPASGSLSTFQLTGSTSLDIADNKVTVDLRNKGLVLSANGIESLDIKVTANLKIAGTEIDPSSLAAVYNRETNRLILTGTTQLLQFGSKKIDSKQGDYLGLENVVLVLGGVGGAGTCRVISLEGTVAAGLAIEGAEFSVDKLTVRYDFDTDTVQITGNASMDVGDKDLGDSVSLEAALPSPGIQFGPSGFSFNAKLNGQKVLGGYTFKLEKSALTYKDSSLLISATTSLYAGTDKLSFGEGTLIWSQGKFARATGKVSGTLVLDQATLELINLDANLDVLQDNFLLNGSFKVQFASGQKDKAKDRIRVGGELELVGGEVAKAGGTVEAGTWEIAPGFTLLLGKLTFEYLASQNSYRLFGNCNANILGGIVGVGVSEPGILWREGRFDSFGGNITGSLSMDFDGNGQKDIELAVTKMGFLIEKTDPWRVTLTGGGLLVHNNWLMVGGGLSTDERGIIFGANGLEHFSLLGSMVFGFGDKFEDTNNNFVWDKNEKYEDRNVDGKYTAGIGIVVSNAGISYTPAASGQSARLKVRGLGKIAFEVGNLAEYPDLGAYVDLGNDGIELVDGRVESFSLVLGANFRIGGLDFVPTGKAGLRYLAQKDQWDLFGSLDAEISQKGYGFSFGESFEKPGIRWERGAITYASAGITGEANLGGANVKFTDAGLGWDSVKEKFSVFGSVKIRIGVEVTVSLGTNGNPGLVIQNNSWDLNSLSLTVGQFNLGSFLVEKINLGFSLTGQEYNAFGACVIKIGAENPASAITFDANFSFSNGIVKEIGISALLGGKVIAIAPYFFINEISGRISNLDVTNLSSLTIQAAVGIQMWEKEIDLTLVPLIGGKVKLAQFFGSATISASALRLQGDMYLGAIERNVNGKRSYKGKIAQGTAALNLDWSRHEYYSDVDLRLLIPGAPFDARLRGKMTFDAAKSSLIVQASASAQIAEIIPVIGGYEFAASNLLMNFSPNSKKLDFVLWGEAKLVFLTKTVGLHWDAWRNKWDVLGDRDDVDAKLSAIGTPLAHPLAQSVSQGLSLASPLSLSFDSPGTSTYARPMSKLVASSLFTMVEPQRSLYSYEGQSSAIPETEVTSGEYIAHFRLEDTSLIASYRDWIGQVRLDVNTIDGIQLEPIPVEFDPSTGYGSIGVRAVPLAGQYLPRGLFLHSTLTSPHALLGTRTGESFSTSEPNIEATWTRAFAYDGILPGVGTDTDGHPISGLNVTRAKYILSFRPKETGTALPTDWVESVRVYADSIPGTDLRIGLPAYDQASDLWSITLTYKPQDLTTIGRKFITTGLSGKITIRTKVELDGVKEDQFGGLDSPDIASSWWAAPSEIEPPQVAPVIDATEQVTTLSGRVHDPRFKQGTVALFYSTDSAGQNKQIAPLMDGTPAIDIPVTIQEDGKWSVDIHWNPSKAPTGQIWLFGWLQDEGPNPAIYGNASPFIVRHDIEGTITGPGAAQGNSARAMLGGIRVFVDINGNGIEEENEPATVSNTNGHYLFDVEGDPASTKLVFLIPDHYAADAGTPANRMINLSDGPVTANLDLIAFKHIIRGSVRVVGNLGQPVPGQLVQATGADGAVFQALTAMDGSFEIPVDSSGSFEIRVPENSGKFYNFQVTPLAESFSVEIGDGPPSATSTGTFHVDSVGIVRANGVNAHETLDTLIEQANQGLISLICFDSSLAGSTLDVVGTRGLVDPSYMLWDSQKREWTYVPEQPALLPNGSREETLDYGLTAFRVRQNLRIDGGDLGITLKGNGFSRAFYVGAQAQFSLSNIGLTNFLARGSQGQDGITGPSESSTGGSGGGAGLGGAILNFGNTRLDNVHFTQNHATGGDGGNTLLPSLLTYFSSPAAAGLPGATDGGYSGQGGAGGGYQAGKSGTANLITLTYTLGDDPTEFVTTVLIAAAGGGGSGLGGGIYNASGAVLTITGGSTFAQNSAVGGKGGTSPKFIANIANALFGDKARTVSVTGFGEAEQNSGFDGAGLGGAIFNDGGILKIDGSNFFQNTTLQAGAALFSLGGSVNLVSSTMLNNISPQDQGVHFVADGNNQGTLRIESSLLKGRQSPLSGKPLGPITLVVEGGQSFGSGNIITSQSGFQGTSFSSKIVPRPQSPFTGEVYIPTSPGPRVEFGALANIPALIGTPTATANHPFDLKFVVSSFKGQPVPTGRLILGIDGMPVAEGYLDSLGKVTLKLPELPAKKVILDVYYEGDGIFAGNISRKTVLIGTQNQRIVQELYQNHLGRNADTEGLRQWVARLDSGVPLEKVVEEFRLSNEATQLVVQNAFEDVLGRSPKTEGLRVWSRYLQNGHSAGDLRAELITSREYQSTHARQDTINSIYQNFLGHEVGQAGIEIWLQNWEQGMTLSQVIQRIRNSQESREHIVDSLYQEILNRPADSFGLRSWTDSLENTFDEDDIAAALLHSTEFAG